MARTNTTNGTQLGLETLEGRDVPATVLIMDFTPDYHQGSFMDTFYRTRYSDGSIPGFFDFNRDRVVDYRDVSLAASQVTGRVTDFFRPFANNPANHLSIGYNDVFSNTNYGYNWLRAGVNSTDLVQVMYFGGSNSGGVGIAGRSPEAHDGENVEGYGETYTHSIAQLLMFNRYATSTDFVNRVAAAAAHEFGHMLGLRHSTSGNPTSVMNPVMAQNAAALRFIAGNQNTENGYLQNEYTELDRSFQWNQRQAHPSNPYLGGQYMHQSTPTAQFNPALDDCDGLVIGGPAVDAQLPPEAAPTTKAAPR